MQLPIFQVDAFTDQRFCGNPAAVCPLDEWLDDSLLQSIASENNLSETAFFVATPSGDESDTHADYELRWFTPTCEVELCGHATLASAFVLYKCLGIEADAVRFATRKSGRLTVARDGNWFRMDFPAQPCRPVPIAERLVTGLRARPAETWQNASHDVAVFNHPRDVLDLRPDFTTLAELAPRTVIATAADDEADFVSRFFAPTYGIDEDPVTGSAHCTLGPLWAGKLGKDSLHGRQVSRRGGDVYCRLRSDRVDVRGRCALYLAGTLTLD